MTRQPAIFYSWQSDRSPVRNKIKRALEIATKNMADSLEEADRPMLDSDTQGAHASLGIVEIILSKIDSCSVFVADVTPVNTIGSKLIPNPNVMIELGYALKAKRRFSVFMCQLEPGQKIENMPFDIRSNNLLVFSENDKPREIAERLKPRLEGLLQETGTHISAENLDIYVCGGSFTRWSNGISATLTIRNAESREYLLSAIEIGGKSAEPQRSLKAGENNKGIVINGISQVFDSEKPLIKMTLKRGSKKYFLEQEVLTVKGADDKHHFTGFVEQSTLTH